MSKKASEKIKEEMYKKMNKKSVIWLLASTITIIFVIFISYFSIYNITDNTIKLENEISRFSKINTEDIEIKKELNLDDKKYLLLSVNNELGQSEFSKGLNNKYKIDSVAYGKNSFYNMINKTNKGKYAVLMGINYDMKIAYVKVEIENKEYKIDIPQDDEYFITYCTVPKSTDVGYIAINTIRFFNKNDIDITQNISVTIE